MKKSTPIRTHEAVLIAWLTIALGACQSTQPGGYSECMDFAFLDLPRVFCEVSFTELLGNPDELNGIDITLKGHVVIDPHGPEGSEAFLVSTMENYQPQRREFLVYLEIPKEFIEAHLVHGMYAMVVGRFNWYPEFRNPNKRWISDLAEVAGVRLNNEVGWTGDILEAIKAIQAIEANEAKRTKRSR